LKGKDGSGGGGTPGEQGGFALGEKYGDSTGYRPLSRRQPALFVKEEYSRAVIKKRRCARKEIGIGKASSEGKKRSRLSGEGAVWDGKELISIEEEACTPIKKGNLSGGPLR